MSRRCFDRPRGGYLFYCRYHDHNGGFCNYNGERPCYPEVVSSIMDRSLKRAQAEPLEGDAESSLERAVESLVNGQAALASELVLHESELEFFNDLDRYGDGRGLLQALVNAGFPNLAGALEKVFKAKKEHG